MSIGLRLRESKSFSLQSQGRLKVTNSSFLLLLVETYEEKKFPVDLPNPIEAIRFRMEQANLKQKDLLSIFGSKGKVSEVLSGKRKLSLAMIRKLVTTVGIPAEVLLQEKGAVLN